MNIFKKFITVWRITNSFREIRTSDADWEDLGKLIKNKPFIAMLDEMKYGELSRFARGEKNPRTFIECLDSIVTNLMTCEQNNKERKRREILAQELKKEAQPKFVRI